MMPEREIGLDVQKESKKEETNKRLLYYIARILASPDVYVGIKVSEQVSAWQLAKAMNEDAATVTSLISSLAGREIEESEKLDKNKLLKLLTKSINLSQEKPVNKAELKPNSYGGLEAEAIRVAKIMKVIEKSPEGLPLFGILKESGVTKNVKLIVNDLVSAGKLNVQKEQRGANKNVPIYRVNKAEK